MRRLFLAAIPLALCGLVPLAVAQSLPPATDSAPNSREKSAQSPATGKQPPAEKPAAAPAESGSLRARVIKGLPGRARNSGSNAMMGGAFGGSSFYAGGAGSEVSDGESEEEQLRVFRLHHAKADDVESLLHVLFQTLTVAADERTNTLVTRGTASELDVVDRVLAELDTAPTNSDPLQRWLQRPQAPRATGLNLTWPGSPGSVPPNSSVPHRASAPQPEPDQPRYGAGPISGLPADLQEKRFPAGPGVRRNLFGSESLSPGGSGAADLERVVREEFAQRQQAQLAEIRFLRSKLDELERRIAAQDRVKELMIRQRVQQLMKQREGDADPFSDKSPPSGLDAAGGRDPEQTQRDYGGGNPFAPDSTSSVAVPGEGDGGGDSQKKPASSEKEYGDTQERR